MDAKTLQARLNVARSFTHTIGRITFRCRLIPELQMVAIYDRHRDSNIEAARAVLAETVLGMTGATLADMRLEGNELIDDSKEAALLLLDERQDIGIDLAAEITDRASNRSKAIEQDAKN